MRAKLSVAAVVAVSVAVLLAGCTDSAEPEKTPTPTSASTASTGPSAKATGGTDPSESPIPDVEWPAQAPMPGGYTQTGASVSEDGNTIEKTASVPGVDVEGTVSDLCNQWENAGATIVESDTSDDVGSIGAMMPDSSIVSVKITTNSDGKTMTADMTWTKA